MSENNTMESINDIDLEIEVTNVLHKARVPANLKGFNYLRTAITLTVKDAEMAERITKLLYPTVAKQYGATYSQVERAIRHAIEVAWARGGQENLSNVLSYEIGDGKSQPANSEFIAATADYLRLKLKTQKR